MARRNLQKAREERARQLVEEVANMAPEVKPVEGKAEGTAPEAQPGAIQFNIDQLFAALGAKDFECSMLRAEVQKLQQQVVTYKNILASQG